MNWPSGKFGVILADPPWTFKTRSETRQTRAAKNHYPTMCLDDICALPVKDLASDDSVLFIYATWPTIFQTQRVIEAWGFTYSGLAWEWIKYNDKTKKYSFGCGYGTRKNLEPLLLARRGSPKLLSRSIRDMLFSPRREHSRKPPEAYGRIESMYAGPYLELFSREPRDGWRAWGNETDKFSVE